MANAIINGNRSKGTISKNIYGHFAEHLGRCIYGGIYVGADSPIPNIGGMRTDVVEALKRMGIPLLRWPGGCFADTYHWRDGIGPQEGRKKIVNTNWGGVTEDNSFGTHEFMELCRQLGCEPYLSGNVGSGTVQEFSDWVEYCNTGGQSPMSEERRKNGQDAPWNVKYWGIGNEAWGCGGNMRPQFYADLCRQYATYLRGYDKARPIYKIASGANADDYNWTKTVMEAAGQFIDAVSLHYYTLPHPNDWQHKGAATGFDRAEYFGTLAHTLRMEELVENHSRIIKQYQGDRKVGLVVDEWGSWYDVEPGTNPGFLYQQNTMRDALVAAINLNIFNDHCDAVVMANIAQVVNVLQAVVLTEGARMVLSPTYHVFEMYKGHQDAKQMESYVETALIGGEEQVPNLHISASQGSDGKVLVTVANLDDTNAVPFNCALTGMGKVEVATGRVLTGTRDAFNTFDAPERVKPNTLEDTILTANGFTAALPACSVTAFEVTVE